MNEINVYVFHKSEVVNFWIFDNNKKIVKNETTIEIVNKNEFIYMMFKIETQFDDRLTTERISTQIEQNDENNRTTIANGRRRPKKSGFANEKIYEKNNQIQTSFRFSKLRKILIWQMMLINEVFQINYFFSRIAENR